MKKKEENLNILHIINGADLGGISTFILNYYRNMEQNRYHFDFCMYDTKLGHNGKELKKMGCSFYTLPSKKKILKYYNTLKEVIKRGNYDVIHVHTNTSSYIPLWIAKRCGVKIRVAHAHSAVVECSTIYKIKAFLGKMLIPRVATKLCPCSTDAGHVVFGKNAKVNIIPNAIDVEKYKLTPSIRYDVRKEIGIQDDEFVIGMIGRLSEEKNTQYAINVFNRFFKEKDNYKLMIVGDGVLREKLEKQVYDCGLSEKILFLGQRSDAWRLYQSFDLFLLPSKYEGFPISAVEALSAGLPVILSENITKDVSFGKNICYLSIEESKMQQWEKVIIYYEKNPVRSNGEEVIENGFDIKSAVYLLEEIYEGVI